MANEKLDTTDTLDKDAWYYLAATMDPSNLARIFINGEEEVSATLNARPSNTQNLIIGARDTGSVQNWGGLIGEARIYHRALTLPEVQHNYLATKWRYR